MVGLSTYAELTKHGTPAMNVSNILSQGFKPGNLSWAGANKIFSSSSPNLISKYGDAAIDLVTPRGFWESRLPFGGGISKEGIGFGSERASSVAQANKGMKFAQRLRAGAYPNSALAQKLLQAGTTYPSLWSRFLPWAGKALRTVGSAPAAGIMTALTPSAGAGAEELAWEKENERRMAEEAARKAAEEAARRAAAASMAQAGTDLSGRGSGRDRGPSEAQQRRDRSGADANRGFTRTRYGKAYQRGGVVSLMDLLNRRV
jgi:hypothetical protein